MKNFLNIAMIQRTSADSGLLTVMSSILHRFEDPGIYHGIVYRGTVSVNTFTVRVSDGTGKISDDMELPQNVSIDLAAFDAASGAGKTDKSRSFIIRKGEYLRFFVSKGAGAYAVELFRMDNEKTIKPAAPAFDSRKLKNNDLFVTILMRPGQYRISNSISKSQGLLTVAYPERGRLLLRMEPVTVECKDAALKPKEVTIQSMQPLVFACVTDSRIMIELQKADDRPRLPRAPRVLPSVLKKRAEKKAAPVKEKAIRKKIRFLG